MGSRCPRTSELAETTDVPGGLGPEFKARDIGLDGETCGLAAAIPLASTAVAKLRVPDSQRMELRWLPMPLSRKRQRRREVPELMWTSRRAAIL